MNIILAIPHSTGHFDLSSWDKPELVMQDALNFTDWHTDRLFGYHDNPRIISVIGGVSRFDCDLERMINDPLEKIGQGILYTVSHSGAKRKLYPPGFKSGINTPDTRLLMSRWYSYRAQLAK